jgi:cytochrome c-type biogenesis protein CcmF
MDLGEILLAVSLISVIYSVYAFYAGVKKRSPDLLENGERAILIYFLAIFFSSILLLSHFLSRDFSYEYVFLNSDSKLPILYTISALWAGKEGSLLIWALFIAIFNLWVVSDKKDALTAYTLAISGTFLAFLNALLLTTSNPFTRIPPQPEGIGLNPLLRTVEMAIHPPIVFLGYAGMLIPFSIALSGLILGVKWEERALKYLTPSWIFLGLGIFVGGWWAYKTLGWGGFWAWDPVENASLFPWLTSTLAFHTFYLQKRVRDSWIKSASYYLVVLTFIFVVFAAFITRSGIISSVHAFGGGAEEVVFLLATINVGVASLYIKRRVTFTSAEEIRITINKETSIVAFLLTLSMLLITVLLGTLVPAFGFEAERNYYESIMFPVEIILIALLGVCIRLKWNRDSELEKFLVPLLILIISSASTFFLSKSILLSFAIGLFAFSMLNYLVGFYKGGMRFLRKYGAYTVHIGVMLLFLGSIGVWTLSDTQRINLSLGGTTKVGDYELKFLDLNVREDEEKFAVFAEIHVYQNGELLGILKPEMKEYKILRQERIISSVEIMSFPLQDLYISMSAISPDFKGIGLEVHVNRLTNLVWIGMTLITLGGILLCLRARLE